MKRITTLLLALIFVGACAVAANGPVNKKRLPKQAQTFLRDYWPNVDIVEAERNGNVYEVSMDDGSTIRFDRKGGWLSVSNRYGFPIHYLPDGIMEFIRAKYPSSHIAYVRHTERGYTVVLNTGLELQYDNGGHIQRVAD